MAEAQISTLVQFAGLAQSLQTQLISKTKELQALQVKFDELKKQSKENGDELQSSLIMIKYNESQRQNKILDNKNEQLDKELKQIINDFKNNIVYVKWQPRNDKGEIIYGQPESIKDYKKKYVDVNMNAKKSNNFTIFTAFIDVDEFIFSPANKVYAIY